MITAHALGSLLALAAALTWGGGDFSGGVAARRHHPFQVLALSAGASLLLLIVLALGRREALPTTENAIWAGSAGVAGALGLAALYRGLATGSVALVAPTAAVIGASLPVLIGIVAEGLPPIHRFGGFFLALAGIWLVARSHGQGSGDGQRNLVLAVLAGIGFGGFLALVAQVKAEEIFGPLVIAKSTSLVAALVLLAGRRMVFPAPLENRVALLSGVLDAGGNIFYLAANQFTRLDIVAALASMYPAGTVLLARALMAEPISGRQWTGVGLCVMAIALMTI